MIGEPTLREFIGEMLTMNYAKLIADAGSNRKEMEKVINQIIINKSGVDPEEVSAEKKIGDDLGIC